MTRSCAFLFLGFVIGSMTNHACPLHADEPLHQQIDALQFSRQPVELAQRVVNVRSGKDSHRVERTRIRGIRQSRSHDAGNYRSAGRLSVIVPRSPLDWNVASNVSFVSRPST